MRLLRRAQIGEELRPDQGSGELGEELEVLVISAGRSSDPDDEIRGPVGRTEVHGLRQAQEAQRRLVHRVGAAVGDREAAGHAGREGLLALQQPRFETVAISAAGGGDEIGQQADHGVLVSGRGDLQPDQVRGHQGSGHGFSFERAHPALQDERVG